MNNLTMENLTENGAFNSSVGMSNFDYEMDLNNYPMLNDMVTYNETNSYTDNIIQMVTSPITNYWASPAVLGSWAYVFIMVVTIIMIYGKSKSLEVTSIIMLLMSLLIIVPGMAGAFFIPGSVMMIMYIFGTLGVAGVLLSMFGE